MMYVNVETLKATNDNVVLKMRTWPSSFASSTLYIPDAAVNKYDNGRELYLGEVVSSGDSFFTRGELVAVDIYFGVHVPSEVRTEKIKIVPSSGIVLKGKEIKSMSDITKMSPGVDRIFLKLRKKESITASGIHIPDDTLKQDPTAQDVRIADIIGSSVEGYDVDDTVVVEAFTGKDVFLDEDDNLYVVCYAADILAKIK